MAVQRGGVLKRLNLSKGRGFPDCPLPGLSIYQVKHLLASVVMHPHKPL